MPARTIPDFRRAAQRRLAAAKYLLESDDVELFRDAMYLAGYVVECSLKALILRRTPRGQLRAMFERISRGARSHDFAYLLAILRRLGCMMPERVAKTMRQLAGWTPDWRYEVGNVSRRIVDEFLNAVVEIRDWVDRSH